MRKPSVPVPLESSSIKRARTSSGVTVYELARRLGISPGAVSHPWVASETLPFRAGRRRVALRGPVALFTGDTLSAVPRMVLV